MEHEHVDVLIVGAGLSGIGAARHLQDRCPDTSFLILEARASLGGTWDLFRYPGIRSDSDMYTLGYRFRPWLGDKALADGPSILAYIRDTAEETGIDRQIRFHHAVRRASWDSETCRWTVHATRADTGEEVQVTASFLHVCSGYYRYDRGYTPDFPGMDSFRGPVIHPQHWPEDLDYAGKKVVVIGSGATAITLVPAMAEQAAHVTMLQRSPTYVATVPSRDAVARTLQAVLPQGAAYRVARWKNVAYAMSVYRASKRHPERVKAYLRGELLKQLPEDYPVDVHFKPRYNPWDQRVCAVADGDLFQAICAGTASVVTDTIERFTGTGILLTSGEALEADIIVTATGFSLQMMGGAVLEVDGETVNMADRMIYKGMMVSDVPNLAFTVGYTNASWTLKADLVSEYVCRLLHHMEAHGYTTFMPRSEGAEVARTPLIDMGSGYVRRALAGMPSQGSAFPWRLRMNYLADVVALRFGRLTDEAMTFR